jgi:hypothetical protein
VTIHGNGFGANTEVDVTLHSANSAAVDLGTFATDASGSFVANVTIPSGTVIGDHHIIETGVNAAGDPATVTLALTVQATASPLPFTGSSSLPLVLTGFGLLGAGALAMSSTRRRQLSAVRLESRERS